MRKLMKTIMIIVTVSFFLFRVTQISEATIIPINNINVPYKSTSVGYSYETIWSMDIPDGMMVSTINISISSDVFGDRYMPHFRILVDGNVVEECQAPKDIRTILLTGLNGKNNVVFQGTYTHAHYTTIYIEGGSIGFDINLADEEARDAALDAKNSADAAKTAAENANANAWQAAVKAQEAAHYANHYGYWSTGYLDGSLNSGKSLAATYDRAGEASQNTTYIRNTQLPGLETTVNTVKDIAEVTKSQTIYNGQSSAYWSYLAAQNAGDNMPPTLECGWQNGATITNTNRQAALWASATDNVSNPSSITLAYSLDGNNYTTFTGTATITFPSSPKYRTVYVRATDEAGKQTVKTLNIFVR